MAVNGISITNNSMGQVVSDYQLYFQKKLELSLQQSAITKQFVWGQFPIVNNSKLCSTPILPNSVVIGYNKHPHQFNVAKVTGAAIERQLQNSMSTMPNFNNFEDLFSWVNKTISGSKPLMQSTALITYDISLRIGFSLTPKILPKDYVYLLGSGPKIGYNNYCAISGKTPIRGYKISISDFSGILHLFRNLPYPESMYIEDILCLYR